MFLESARHRSTQGHLHEPSNYVLYESEADHGSDDDWLLWLGFIGWGEADGTVPEALAWNLTWNKSRMDYNLKTNGARALLFSLFLI